MFNLVDLPEGLCFCCVAVAASHRSRLLQWTGAVPELSARAVEKRQNEFYSGRWAAAQAIDALTGKRITPNLANDRSPLWPPGLVGSISHTNDWALALVADAEKAHRIGLDLESVQAVSKVSGLAQMITSSSERALLSDHKQVVAFTENVALALVFSAKESLFKALYPEVREYFDYFDAELVRVDHGSLELRLLRDLNDGLVIGSRFRIFFLLQDQHVLTWHLELL